MFTKSGIMVGLGEERNEVLQLMDDLRAADVDFLTIGQYLQPTKKHHPVIRYLEPPEFEALKSVAYVRALTGAGIPLAEVIAQASWRGRDWLGLPGLVEGPCGWWSTPQTRASSWPPCTDRRASCSVFKKNCLVPNMTSPFSGNHVLVDDFCFRERKDGCLFASDTKSDLPHNSALQK